MKAKCGLCEGQRFTARGKMKSEVADFDEAFGQDMLQETVEEFKRRQGDTCSLAGV
jgi:hypothetical protein